MEAVLAAAGDDAECFTVPSGNVYVSCMTPGGNSLTTSFNPTHGRYIVTSDGHYIVVSNDVAEVVAAVRDLLAGKTVQPNAGAVALAGIVGR